MKLPFCGPAYSGPSLNINAQECVNFLLNVDGEGAKSIYSLIGRFGLDLFANLGASEIRGTLEAGDIAFVVCGNKFLSIDNNGNETHIGTIGTTTGVVGMAYNGLEVVIVDGSLGYSYIIASADFAQIVDAGFLGGNDVQFVNQYFVVDNLTTGTAQVSALNNGRSWSTADTATPEADPDGLVRCMVLKSTILMMGESTIEPWYDAQLPYGFPFLVQQGGVLEIGLAARWGAIKAADTIFWLGQNKSGIVGIMQLGAGKISTEALDNEISGYSSVRDCIAWTLTDRGHTLVGFTFPAAGKTWVYDVTMSNKAGKRLWYEFRSWGQSTFRAAFHMYFNGRHILGDRSTGKLYQINWSTYQDNGDIIDSYRTTQHIDADQNDIEWKEIEIIAETGVGPAEAEGVEEPVAMLSYSDDGGHTFSQEMSRSLGWMGEYKKQLRWHRKGQSRDRVWRLRITSNCKRVVIGATADIEVKNE